MTAPAFAILTLIVAAGMAGLATAAPPPGGQPAGAAVPHHGAYPGGAHGHWLRPGVRIHYGGPYWGGWGWPGYYAYGSIYAPGYYGYVPPSYVYGPPGVVTATAGVVYVELDAGTLSTQQPEPAPAPPAAREAAAAAAPPAGTPWWYLCRSPHGAYPYVRECPGGWERVPAVPPDLAK